MKKFSFLNLCILLFNYLCLVISHLLSTVNEYPPVFEVAVAKGLPRGPLVRPVAVDIKGTSQKESAFSTIKKR